LSAFEDALAKGIELFNVQEFYEAHEAWEAAWLDEPSDNRLLLQGLIQVAAGFYKLQVGAPVGTVKLLDAALPKLRRFQTNDFRVDVDRLLPEVEQWLAQARQMVSAGTADFDPKRLPRLTYVQTLH